MDINKKGVNNVSFAPLSFFFKQDNKSILLSVLLLYQTKGWKNGKAWLDSGIYLKSYPLFYDKTIAMENNKHLYTCDILVQFYYVFICHFKLKK